MTLWRISNHSDLEGLCGERTDGRWHTAARGKRVLYLSEHPAVALIEVLANLKGKPELFPDRYQLMKLRAADGISLTAFDSATLSPGWRENIPETQAAGDSWLSGRISALLSVPSVPSPDSLNYLFNPRHANAKDLAVEWCKWVAYDKRLFRVNT